MSSHAIAYAEQGLFANPVMTSNISQSQAIITQLLWQSIKCVRWPFSEFYSSEVTSSVFEVNKEIDILLGFNIYFFLDYSSIHLQWLVQW